MKTKLPIHHLFLDLISLAAVWAALSLAGCVKQQAYEPVASTEPLPPPPAAPFVREDDYVYYPEYEIYYSSQRHLYGYWESGAWYWRPEPPRVAVNVLYASPSVRLDFHDAPERHHSTVVKRYPHDWRPPGPPHGDDDKDKKTDEHRH
jgi:hypothetical protein